MQKWLPAPAAEPAKELKVEFDKPQSGQEARRCVAARNTTGGPHSTRSSSSASKGFFLPSNLTRVNLNGFPSKANKGHYLSLTYTSIKGKCPG